MSTPPRSGSLPFVNYAAWRPSRTTVDAVALVSAAALAIALCWILVAPFWVADLLIYAVPLAYLLFSSREVRLSIHVRFVIKAILFCAIFFTYVGVQYEGWTGPSAMPLLLGVPFEQAFWGALVIPLTIAVDQRFFVRRSPTRQLVGTRQLVYLLFLCGLAIAFFPPLRDFMDNYVYLKIGLIIYPLLLLLAFRLGRPVVREILWSGVVFSILNLGFELLAMHHGYWDYRGDYVGWLTIGAYRFPVEELLFIIVLSSPGIVAAHALRWNWKGLTRPPRPR